MAQLRNRRLIIASTDVHEHAIMILSQLCREAGAKIFYIGAEKNPEEVVASAIEYKADGVLLSTHNGMALEYSKALSLQMNKHKVQIPVIIGGVLNQKMNNCELPVEVSKDLKKWALSLITNYRIISFNLKNNYFRTTIKGHK